MGRPSVILLVTLWAGLLAGGHAGDRPWIFLILVAAPVVGLALVTGARVHLALLGSCLLLMGVLRSPDAAWNHGEDRLGTVPDRFPVVLGLESMPLSGVSTGFRKARVTEVIAGYPALEGEAVLVEPAADGTRGESYILAGTFRKPGLPLNPYAFDRRAQARRRGIAGYLTTGQGKSVSSARGRWAESHADRIWSLGAWRERVASLIRRAARGDCAGVLEAMLLGRRDGLSPGVRSLMVRAGTYHVLAISGLHVGIVVLLLASCISMLRLPRAGRMVLALICVSIYVVFTGARPSALRAGTFFALVSVARLLEWRVDYPNAVCATGTVLLLLSPHLAWDLGFQLSLGAVFGITLLVPQIRPAGRGGRSRTGRLFRYLMLGMAASFCAQVFTLPLIMYHFGRVSLAGVVTNLAVLPLTTLVVAAGLEASVAALVWDRLALIFMRAAAVLADTILASVSLAMRLADPLLVTGRPPVWKAATYYAVVMCLGLAAPRMRKRYKVPLLLASCLFMLAGPPGRHRGELRATFIYVGDGDACLIEAPDGRTVMVDAGPAGSDFDAADLYIVPLLALKGISRLDVIIVTHPHSDHYGGLGTLAANLEIGEIMVGSLRGEATFRAALEEAETRGTRIREVGRGYRMDLGGAVIEFLHPSHEFLEAHLGEACDANSISLVFTLQLDEVRFLFTGDATPEAQQEILLCGGVGPCQVLKVPHHGAPNAVDGAFLDALEPEWAVVSSGSRFRLHPAPGTIDMLEGSGARVLTTESDGAVTVTTDGRSIDIQTRAGGNRGVKSRGIRPE